MQTTDRTRTAKDPIGDFLAQREARVTKAIEMRLNGASLYAIADALGVTKEWLRTYAGLR